MVSKFLRSWLMSFQIWTGRDQVWLGGTTANKTGGATAVKRVEQWRSGTGFATPAEGPGYAAVVPVSIDEYRIKAVGQLCG